MIIGVRNDQFTWMYGMGFGVPRALGGIPSCTYSECCHVDLPHWDGLEVAWGDVSWIKFAFFSYTFCSPS